jgi:hypothetical protein
MRAGQDADQPARTAARLFQRQPLGGERALPGVEPGQAERRAAGLAGAAFGERRGAEQRIREARRQRRLEAQRRGRRTGRRRIGIVAQAGVSVGSASPCGKSAGTR